MPTPADIERAAYRALLPNLPARALPLPPEAAAQISAAAAKLSRALASNAGQEPKKSL